MKTLTCNQLGGPCEQELSADSWGDMVKAMTVHVMDNHPDTAKEMTEMHAKDPEAWGKEYKPVWDAAPEQDPSEVKDDETQLPEDNEIAKENMFNNLDEDASDVDDPNAPRIVEDQ